MHSKELHAIHGLPIIFVLNYPDITYGKVIKGGSSTYHNMGERKEKGEKEKERERHCICIWLAGYIVGPMLFHPPI